MARPPHAADLRAIAALLLVARAVPRDGRRVTSRQPAIDPLVTIRRARRCGVGGGTRPARTDWERSISAWFVIDAISRRL
jgi:hypothetical protein